MASLRDVRGLSRGLVVESQTDFKISSRVYTDPALFDEEMHVLFEQGWVYVAHESELLRPGDFKTAAVGRIPVIVSRGEDQQVHVVVNACRHRGSAVCREESGHRDVWVCPYHGWAYRSDGTLLAISDRSGYPEGWGADIKGLVPADRVAVYRGLVFASFSKNVPELEDYLGPARKYVDFWLDHSPTGTIRLSQPFRVSFPANWKFQYENSTDGWHARYVHESAIKTMDHFGTRSARMGWPGLTRGFAQGHGVLERPRTDIPPDLQDDFDAHRDLLVERYGRDTAEDMFVRRHIALFPNLHLMEFKIRVIQPVAVDSTIVYEYPVELGGVPDSVNRAIRSRILQEISISSGSLVSGFINADDVEVFTGMHSGLSSGRMEWVLLSRGMEGEEERAGGERLGGGMDEVPQRAFYRAWAERLGLGVE